MADIHLPHNFKLRPYQKALWDYWVLNDGRHGECIWHRRAGKDAVVLHGTACKAHERIGNYWHMLPQANQARKAIWEAVNPHTGIRRIDEAFPRELRESTRDTDMLIRFKNGSTWQVLGSDNFQTAIGSTPCGIVYSEWALANPTARGYLRPILSENKGWQMYITTPRGRNHAYSTFLAAQKDPDSFAERLTIHDTGVLTTEELLTELSEYVSTYGEAMGISLFEQEYECSFDAAILGSYYGAELRDMRSDGRITDVPHDPAFPVHVALDIGYDDDTAIIWFQVISNEIRILESLSDSGKAPDFYISQLKGRFCEVQINLNSINVFEGGDIRGLEHRRAYEYGTIWLPHDAKAKTLAAKGKTIQEQFAKSFGWGKVRIVPSLSIEDGIIAMRQMLRKTYVDSGCEDLMSAWEQYQREWDDEKKMFKDKPLHDWTSHYADAGRYMAIAWQHERPEEKPREIDYSKLHKAETFEELLAANRKTRLRRENA